VTQDGKDEWRELQQYAIGAITEAFKTHKFVMANMPTGSGKTIVGAAVARMLGLPSLSLTHTIQLQEQYRNTLPWAGVMTGRSNYLCKRYKPELQVTAANAQSLCLNCPFNKKVATDCDYYKMFHKTVMQEEVILNYAYATRILKSGAFTRKLLICDEADLVEGALVDAVKLEFNLDEWYKEDLPLPPGVDADYYTWETWAYEVQPELTQWAASLVAALDVGVDEHGDRLPPNRADVRQLNIVRRLAELVDTIINVVDGDTWVVTGDSDKAVVRPIWGMTVADTSLWKHSERVLLMSATLGNPKILATKLGIAEEDYKYLDFPSTFPVENRLNYYWPVAKINKDSGDADWDTLASAIEFVGSHHLGEKGLIHCGSYKIGKELYRRLSTNSERYILQTPRHRIEDLARFTSSDEPLVMVTPSFSTGLDLPYAIGWQVIAKMPFGNLGDQVVRLRRDTEIDGKPFGRKNYDAEAINTVIQACGRAVRSPDDKGTNYILDGNFWNLAKRSFTPPYFKESIRWLEKEKT